MNSREQKWVKIFSEQKASGLSQKGFCEQRQIKLSTFLYWRGRIKSSGTNTLNKMVEIIENGEADKNVSHKQDVRKGLEIRWSKNSGFRFHLRWG